jgi:hypothetical protein
MEDIVLSINRLAYLIQKPQQVSEKHGKTLSDNPTPNQYTIDELTSDKVATDKRTLLRNEFIRQRAAKFKRELDKIPEIGGTFLNDVVDVQLDSTLPVKLSNGDSLDAVIIGSNGSKAYLISHPTAGHTGGQGGAGMIDSPGSATYLDGTLISGQHTDTRIAQAVTHSIGNSGKQGKAYTLNCTCNFSGITLDNTGACPICHTPYTGNK